jgi:hypothetical protein
MTETTFAPTKQSKKKGAPALKPTMSAKVQTEEQKEEARRKKLEQMQAAKLKEEQKRQA